MKRALSLYEWNIDLGRVLMRDIAHFEVALRNAYDRVMRDRWEGGLIGFVFWKENIRILVFNLFGFW